MLTVIISKMLQDWLRTACLLVATGSLESPEISYLQKTFLTGKRSKEGTISLMPITATLRTPSIVFGLMSIFDKGKAFLCSRGIIS